jgi:ribosomal protein S12 methylthiotransferase
MEAKEKIGIISLGCAKNLVDSENLLGLLRENGFPIVAHIEEAEIGIVNTCGFIQAAVEETIDTILEIAALKNKGRLKRILVIGCFVQRYGYRLAKEIPEVDAWVGTGQIEKVVDLLLEREPIQAPVIIRRPIYLADHNTPRVQTTPFFSAYLKIAEGCSNKCSYCIIPKLTGPFRSRALESLVIEARKMAENGVRELNLVAQDTTDYGSDLQSDACLEVLLERLLSIQALDWIRVLYCNPNRISENLLRLLSSESRICPYLDIPMQHIHPQILERMGRPFKDKSPWDLIASIRSQPRPISLRTTFMLGFPGETDEIFEELMDFVKWVEFDHLGVFGFSPEKGTAAFRFKDLIDPKVVKRRINTMMLQQAKISYKKNQAMIGKTVSVLIEGESPETELLLKGRTAAMAPDVDGCVLINKGRARVGEMVTVLITEAYPYDLVGEIMPS